MEQPTCAISALYFLRMNQKEIEMGSSRFLRKVGKVLNMRLRIYNTKPMISGRSRKFIRKLITVASGEYKP